MQTVRLAGWRSQQGKNAYLAAYDSAMALWLTARHRVYSVDFIGSAGKGTQIRPLLTRTDCGCWLAR